MTPTKTHSRTDKSLRDKALAAARKILGDQVYDALTASSSAGPIKILRMAAYDAFIHELKGVHIEDLRRALKELDEVGEL